LKLTTLRQYEIHDRRLNTASRIACSQFEDYLNTLCGICPYCCVGFPSNSAIYSLQLNLFTTSKEKGTLDWALLTTS
jgi:hypothetical protein